MSKKYHPDLCRPAPITKEWENHIKKNFYVNNKGQIFKLRSGFKEIGTITKQGYRTCCLRLKGKQKNFKNHHLVWLLTTGSFPDKEIHHKNNQRADNFFDNLEQVTREENLNHRYKQQEQYDRE